jgi:hypothetical protein
MERPTASEVVRRLLRRHGELRKAAETIERLHDEIACDVVTLLPLWKPGETKYIAEHGTPAAHAITRTRNDDLDVERIEPVYPFELEWPKGEEKAAAEPDPVVELTQPERTLLIVENGAALARLAAAAFPTPGPAGPAYVDGAHAVEAGAAGPDPADIDNTP